MRDERPDREERKRISQSQKFKVMCPLGCDKAFYKRNIPEHIADEHSE